VLDVLVPEIVLQSAGIVAVVGELEEASVTKHVRMDRKGHLCGLAEALDEMMETHRADRAATLRNEHIGLGLLVLTP
jgi:hypothetical protein